MPIFPKGTGQIEEGSGPGQGPLGWKTGVGIPVSVMLAVNFTFMCLAEGLYWWFKLDV